MGPAPPMPRPIALSPERRVCKPGPRAEHYRLPGAERPINHVQPREAIAMHVSRETSSVAGNGYRHATRSSNGSTHTLTWASLTNTGQPGSAVPMRPEVEAPRIPSFTRRRLGASIEQLARRAPWRSERLERGDAYRVPTCRSVVRCELGNASETERTCFT